MVKKAKTADLKKITRRTTAAVFALAAGIIGATAWFVASAVSDAASFEQGTAATGGHVAGIDTALLDRTLKAEEIRTSSANALPDAISNPY